MNLWLSINIYLYRKSCGQFLIPTILFMTNFSRLFPMNEVEQLSCVLVCRYNCTCTRILIHT
jgi:hypothetical protein